MKKANRFKQDREKNTLQGAYDGTYGGQDIPEDMRLAIREEFANYASADAQDGLALREDGLLQYADFTLSPVGIAEYGEHFEALGQLLSRMEKALQWWLGDFANYAGREHGKTYLELADQFGYQVNSLHQFAWVASSVEISIRIETLSFGHHMAVAASNKKTQQKWLGLAAEGDVWIDEGTGVKCNKPWSIARMKREMKEGSRPTTNEWSAKHHKQALDRLWKAVTSGDTVDRALIEQVEDWLRDVRNNLT